MAVACPPESVLGFSWSWVHIVGGGLPTIVPTAVYNVETLGLEPARLGTGDLSLRPARPLPGGRLRALNR